MPPTPEAPARPQIDADLVAAGVTIQTTRADIASASASRGASSIYRPSSRYRRYLERLLAMRTAGIEPTRSGLSGERDILDGQLHLGLEHPDNAPARLLLAHTLRGLKKVRPDIMPEFRARVELLQKEIPLPEPAQSVVSRILAEPIEIVAEVERRVNSVDEFPTFG